MSASETIHEYFERKVSDWDIVRFLEECTSIGSYRQKIECYLSSLELIVNTENGQRREKAQVLLDAYSQASIRILYQRFFKSKWRGRGPSSSLIIQVFEPSHKDYAGAQSNRPDKKRAKEWEKTRSNTQINIHRSTINGTVGGITNGVYGPMSGGVFDVKLAPKRSNQKENNDKVPKRVKINDATPQREQDEQENQQSSDNNISKEPRLMESNDSSILKSGNSKINQGDPSSKFNQCYDARKRTKIIYSWGDVIDKIDFRNISKKDWIFENYNLSNEFRDFQKMTIQQVKENPYLCYKEDIQKILCLSNIMLIERIKPTYLSCDLASWNTICRRKTSSYLSSTVNNVVLEYSLKWKTNGAKISPESQNWIKGIELFFANAKSYYETCSINKDNEDTFVHNTLHNLISEIFRDPMLELYPLYTCVKRANSESSASKSRRLSNKENGTVKGNKPDFKISTNTKDEILFGEVKPRDTSSVLVKKDLVKLAEYQAGTLDELIKKYGNRIGMISFGIWVCGEHIRIYEMDLNNDGIYRMILVADVCVPIEREKIVGLVPVLEAFYNVKHRISELLTVIASNSPPSSPSRSSYVRMPTLSPKPVRVAIAGLQP
ncbi:7481_t:CDS:10 [Funneliformis mosseae]|uniref:7481_t:CDS:1 n=1 Tax=Funneliformis mosseae TaxID=27381 RepID=A0A9N9HJL5_FUNMO|nr:7481_t:CDS:10 [Funneliformis mosseae]